MKDQYTLTVTFTRSRDEDAGVLEAEGKTLTRETAIAQLARELQEACDNGMAGEFVVTACDLAA